MDINLYYSFDDEVAIKFSYNMVDKKIEIHFEGYYNVSKEIYVSKPCVWVIENWAYAKSKLHTESSYSDLEQYLGIVSMVLSIEQKNNTIALIINTLDNRYIDLLFDSPNLRLEL